MKSYRRQRGISIWLAAVLFICLACIGLVALKLFPVYMESLKIDRALTALVENEDLRPMSKTEIRNALLRRLDIDGVESVRHANFWDVTTITKDSDGVTIDIVYEKVVPMAVNVSALVDFEKSITAE